jgi:hypothetical protein
MNLLTELMNIMNTLDVPVEMGVFSGEAPKTYAVLTPMVSTFDLYADNYPGVDIQEARVSLFTKNNYLERQDQIVRACMNAGMTITSRSYIGHEDDTGYHHYAIDVEQLYVVEEE